MVKRNLKLRMAGKVVQCFQLELFIIITAITILLLLLFFKI